MRDIHSGNDVVDGGPGYDTSVIGVASTSVTATLLQNGDIQLVSGADTITFRNVELFRFTDVDLTGAALAGPRQTGTASGDSLTGDARPDYIDGRGGNDTLSGLGGNDELVGGNGNDSILGGDGNDAIDGGSGDDRLDAASTRPGAGRATTRSLARTGRTPFTAMKVTTG